MEKCDADVLYIIGFIASSILFLSSEIIGNSKCDASGVISFCLQGYTVTIKKGCGGCSHDEEAEEAQEAEEAPLLN